MTILYQKKNAWIAQICYIECGKNGEKLNIITIDYLNWGRRKFWQITRKNYPYISIRIGRVLCYDYATPVITSRIPNIPFPLKGCGKGGESMHLENFIKNFRSWQGVDSIFIEAPTGMGKTTFVLNQLVENAMNKQQEVLFLSNRYLLKEQIKHSVAKKQGIPVEDNNWLEEIGEFEGITILSYQKIQTLMEVNNAGRYLDIKRYKYTVFDEIHYILEDSIFNPYIFYLLQFIQKCPNTKVFMSATLAETKDYLIDSGILGKVIPYSNVRLNAMVERELVESYIFRITGYEKYIWHYTIPKQKRKIEVKYFSDFIGVKII